MARELHSVEFIQVRFFRRSAQMFLEKRSKLVPFYHREHEIFIVVVCVRVSAGQAAVPEPPCA